MGVSAVRAKGKIARLHGGAETGGHGLLAQRKMAGAFYQVLQEKIVGALLGFPDFELRAVHPQTNLFAYVVLGPGGDFSGVGGLGGHDYTSNKQLILTKALTVDVLVSSNSPVQLNQIAIVIPVYNDWTAAQRLLPLLDRALPCACRVLLVDDGSAEDPESAWPRGLSRIADISVLYLRRNLGHQRAIAIGLVHVYQNWGGVDAVMVMDGDGEDRPQDIPALLDRFVSENGRKVVFAARAKRLESAVFRFFYRAYRILHKALTGVAVRVGNFSVAPPQALGRLMVVSELWNHYAAAVFRARIPHTSIPLPRGARLAGRSQMNFVSLLVHGLGAISVFSDVVGARLLAVTAFAIILTLLLVGVVAGVRLFTDLAIPGWATYVTGILLIVAVQALMVSLALVFIIVSGRAAAGFLPIRDAGFYIERVEQVYP
jgi:hypothetical protein